MWYMEPSIWILTKVQWSWDQYKSIVVVFFSELLTLCCHHEKTIRKITAEIDGLWTFQSLSNLICLMAVLWSVWCNMIQVSLIVNLESAWWMLITWRLSNDYRLDIARPWGWIWVSLTLRPRDALWHHGTMPTLDDVMQGSFCVCAQPMRDDVTL